MTDHNSVKEAETAAAGKLSELTNAMIRTLLQHRTERAREHLEKSDRNHPAQPKEPSQGDTALFEKYYQKYQENGVEPRTARNAAADAVIGLGSTDSPAIAAAESQVIAHSQGLIKVYTKEAAIVAEPTTSREEQARSSERMAEIERALGISGLPTEIKAQTINGLNYRNQSLGEQPIIQAKPTQLEGPNPNESLTLSSQQETLRQTHQEKLEKAGAKTPTATWASRDIVIGKGAADSPHITIAHQEIEHHQLLKRMYQSVFEEFEVSPEVASKAADQLAWGNGANRSSEVQQAHTQALANIARSQEHLVGQQQSSEEKADTRSSESIEISRQSLSPQQIWEQFSAGENGVFESMAKGNESLQRLSDQLIAKDALLAGHSPKAIQAAISQHSPLAQRENYPDAYAIARVTAAEKSPEVEEKRAQENIQAQGTDQKKLASRKDAQRRETVRQNSKPRKRAKTKEQEMSL